MSSLRLRLFSAFYSSLASLLSFFPSVPYFMPMAICVPHLERESGLVTQQMHQKCPRAPPDQAFISSIFQPF